MVHTGFRRSTWWRVFQPGRYALIFEDGPAIAAWKGRSRSLAGIIRRSVPMDLAGVVFAIVLAYTIPSN